MLSLLRGGRVVDPAHGLDATADVWFEDGRIARSQPGRRPDETYDATGLIVHWPAASTFIPTSPAPA